MPETKRYTDYVNLARKSLVFTATYIKNGMCRGSREPTMLLTNICINGEQILDHVWVRDKIDIHIQLRNKQHKIISFLGRLIQITKVKDITTVKDLGLVIKKLL